MIPILYAANETVFTHNGIGLLADAIQCEVTEERNGIYEAVIQYPVTGIHYASIVEDCVVKILPNEISSAQLFRIYKTGKPIDGIVTISLEHISYTLNGNPVATYSVSNVAPAAAIQAALNGATFAHSFTAWSDITSLNSTLMPAPTSVRAILGGTEGGILDKWHGEYEFDNYVVKLHAARGDETDVVIEYGKNLTDLKQERNITNVYTALFPYAKYVTKSTVNGVEVETEHLVTLTEKVIAAPTAASYAHSKAMIKDFSAEFERDDEITESLLRAAANAYLSDNPIDEPSVNITVSFVQLWQTAEYANIAPLERVKLCDTVTVRFAKLGISATAKVIKTVYDSLLERYKTIELGTAKSNFGETLNNQQSQINGLKKEIVTQTGALHQAILNATALITGQAGGYVVFNPAENPQEILIMNTADINTATKVWRWNSAGLGYSSTGYNGDFSLAMTMDGAIVADFITTGTLSANLVRAGMLQSFDGNSWFNLDEGGFTARTEKLQTSLKSGYKKIEAEAPSTDFVEGWYQGLILFGRDGNGNPIGDVIENPEDLIGCLTSVLYGINTNDVYEELPPAMECRGYFNFVDGFGTNGDFIVMGDITASVIELIGSTFEFKISGVTVGYLDADGFHNGTP